MCLCVLGELQRCVWRVYCSVCLGSQQSSFPAPSLLLPICPSSKALKDVYTTLTRARQLEQLEQLVGTVVLTQTHGRMYSSRRRSRSTVRLYYRTRPLARCPDCPEGTCPSRLVVPRRRSSLFYLPLTLSSPSTGSFVPSPALAGRLAGRCWQVCSSCSW